ncbi:aspartate kinase [Candidatus Gottesmanbacteria bacterium RIFCSPLOWO2_01_FULL_39_12b]|uniref:Uridylate kinase n=1 Tax=Candidatus Gottesmanbacteria bacterium RIFCSPLOWO2_01_FULL_39_12b TaxID=1798388 RepID=A0A1F6AM54_9BACT|nr:MAG: aspartate kinase [Candidatus Gottesmanbacteria bacterium RIFCSPLOWO2_01_FULL_39_12b]
MDKSRPIVISLGGSLVVPNGGMDLKFLSEFNSFIRNKIASKWRFFIVIGGGSTARHYIDAAKNVAGNITDWDLDYLGIHATRLNAHLIRTIFQDIAHPRIIQNYERKIANLTQPLVVASGWKPGRSTDYDAVLLARDYGSQVIINMSNISQVYDKDPNKYNDARPINKISWEDFEKLVGTTWSPGSNLPFDPIATKLAKKLNLTVYVIGKDLINLDKLLNKQNFLGTVISGR